MMSMADPAGATTSALAVNPYAGHRLLSDKEQQVLGEYARLAATIKRVSISFTSTTKRLKHPSLCALDVGISTIIQSIFK